MAPPPLPPSMSAASGHQTGQSSQPPPTLPQPDLFAELLRMGLNPDDMTKQSSNRPQVREEVLKNLQNILGKRDSADILRKLLPIQNEWQTNQQAPDYQRVIPGNSGSGAPVGYRDNTLGGPILGNTSAGSGGAISFTNNIINGNSSQQQEQDVQYASAQQQQQHQAAASAVNHHQHFRIPTTNTTMHNSPLQQQQQQLLSQHNKSVLSLHHQQQQHQLTHPHQNDPAHRQRLNQQHKLNSVPNSSMANINDISGGPSSSSLSSSSAALLDTKNSSIFSHRTSPAISSYTIPSAGTTPRVPNIMDAIGGQPGLDNMHDTTPFQQTITMNNRDKLKSLAKHQHLQKQFRTTADKHKNLPWPNQSATSSSANLNLVADPQSQQRIIGSNINNSNTNNMGLSQLQRQITSPLSSAISPPQASPGLPKSLLNLAACSTSPPSASNANPMSSNSRIANQLSSARSTNINQIGNTANTSTNNRSIVRSNANNPGQRANSSADSNNLLQQIMARSSNTKNPVSNSANRSNYSNFSLSSLLSDDQSSNPKNNNNGSNNNNRSVVNQNTASNVRSSAQTSQPIQRRPSSAKSDDSFAMQVNANSKDAYLAYLQERAAKGGVSIGEITCSASNHIVDQPSQLQSVLMTQHDSSEPNDESQGDIESALSRVEARNDLSLLYPPVSLASNSQKQINSLSAGIKLPEEVDLFTDEVKKIVQEGCNIIYECKTCSNLFRSLANLVKHKRLYCKENTIKATQLELNRRSNINSVQTVDMSVTKNSRDSVISRPVASRDNDDSKNSLLVDRPRQPGAPPVSIGSQKYNLRGKRIDVSCLTGDTRSGRAARNQQKDNRGQSSPGARNYADTTSSSSGQTNLSRLLQSQPRNRVGPMKVDSALMDALSMGPALPVGSGRGIVGSPSIGKFNEQLVRNSSLAKTLLSENVRSINGNQSNFDMSNIESNAANNQKPPTTPKRKFLEDCIRKVKRDKLGPNDSVGSDSTPVYNQDALGSISQDESEQYRDPLDIDDSGADSDALVMDVEESYLPRIRKKVVSDRKLLNRSQTRSATSSLETASRLNSSSALLKALTRPVEPKPSYPTSQKVDTSKQPPQTSNPEDDKSTTTGVKPSNSTGNLQEKTSDVEAQQGHTTSDVVNPMESVSVPMSPILDRFNCEACITEFPDHQTLFEHIINDHKSLKKIHPCIFCSLSFITLENVCRHIIDIHKKTKTQVGRLKDVVESRSFYSSDFTACTDVPPSCKDLEKDKVGTDRKAITPDTLSDLAATEQILNDTVALVSMASSPSKSTVFSPSKRLPSLVSRTSSRLAAKRSPTTDETKGDSRKDPEIAHELSEIPFASNKERSDLASNDGNQDEADDLLSDSMIPNITDEHLAILERQEAEIEAERLRKQQEDDSDMRTGSIEAYHEVGNNAFEGDNLHMDDDSSNAGKTQTSVDEPSVDEGPVDQSDFIGDEDSNQWASRQNEQGDGEKNVIDRVSCKSHTDLCNPVEDNDDSQSTLESIGGALCRGKHVYIDGQQREAEINDIELDHVDDEEEDAESQDQGSWGRPTTSSASSTSSGSTSLDSNDSDGTDSDRDSSDANNLQRGATGDDNDLETNEQVGESDNKADDDDDEAGGDQQSVSVITSKRKASNCGSTKRETDLNSSEIGDKISKYEYYDNTSSHSSSKASSKASAANTMDGAGGCKLKLKAASSSTREGGGGSSGASTSSGGAAAGSSSGSGGIMKLKIQLKTQPDEKSKVYRIVE